MFVLALLTLLVVRVIPAALRAVRALRVRDGGDRAAAVLALAVRGLPADRADWGLAMVAELDEARGPRERRRFSRGCARAVAVMRLRAALGGPHRDGAGVRAVVLAAAAAALVLAGYGLVRYPLLRADDGAQFAVGVLVAVLLGYAACAIGLSRGTTLAATGARGLGVTGGLAAGAAWLVVVFPTASLKAWVAVPLLVAVLVPAAVAVLAGRASGDWRAATAAAVWCGLVGGLLIFLVWVTSTYLQDGGPFDPQLIRDFQASGAPDLPTYAVGDNLGGAIDMLIIVPVIALALGSLAARSVARPRGVSGG